MLILLVLFDRDDRAQNTRSPANKASFEIVAKDSESDDSQLVSPPEPKIQESPSVTQNAFLDNYTVSTIDTFTLLDGPYRVESEILQTSFHKPLIRHDKRFFGKGHVREGELVSERISVANEFIVSKTPNSHPNEIAEFAAAIGALLAPVRGSNSLYRLVFDTEEDFETLPQRVQMLEIDDSIIRYTEPDFIVSTASIRPNDPRFEEQLSLHSSYTNKASSRDIDAPEAWSINNSSPQVIIAVIDSGIRRSHQDLAQNLWTNLSETANGKDDDKNGIIDDIYGFNAIDKTGNVEDDNGHGTHVSGIAAARGNNGKGIAGVTWNAQIMSLKFLDANGYGTNSDAIEAINYAIANGAHILNNSWGGSTQSQSVYETLKKASDQGILIVTAAGNDGYNLDETPSYPASFQIANQVVVTATDGTDNLAPYSNYSSSLAHISAPGRALSTYNASDSSYRDLEGTSMAAPHVTGALALIKATFPEQPPNQNIIRLLDSVDQFPALTSKCLSEGRLNLHRALSGQTNSPPNDSFEKAISFFSNGGKKAGTTSNASEQADEPFNIPSSKGNTVWYSWFGNSSGNAQLRINPTGFAASISVYSGESIAALSHVESSSSLVAGQPANLSWQYEDGIRYFIQVDSTSLSTGPFTLELFKTPDNDKFENSTQLSGTSFTVAGNNIAATLENGETPVHISAAGSTVWYDWTAPTSGDFSLRISQTNERLFLRVFEGDSIASIQESSTAFEEGSQSNQVVQVTAETKYRLLIDSLSENGTEFQIEGSYLTAPRILVQPHDRNVSTGNSTIFRVVVSSANQASYQWFKDSDPIPNATSSSFLISSVEDTDLGAYQAQINLPNQTLHSRVAHLTSNRAAVQFLSQPAAASIRHGQTANISSVVAPIDDQTQIQWLKDGKPIPLENALTLSIPNANITDSGFYQLSITLDGKTSYSKSAYLYVSADDDYSAFSWAPISDTAIQAHELDVVNGYYIALHSDTGFSFSMEGDYWHYVPLPVRKISWTGDQYIAVTSEAIYTSPNLSHWTEIYTPASELYSITYGNSTAVVRAEDGLYTSSDFTNWAKTSNATSQWADHIAFGNGTFVVPRAGSVLVSTDGIQWTSYNTPTNNQCYAAFCDGKWWLYNRYNAGPAYTSPDTQTWIAFSVDTDKVFSMFFDKSEDIAYMILETIKDPDSFFSDTIRDVHRVKGDQTEFVKRVTRYSSDYPPLMAGNEGEVLVSARSGYVLLKDFTTLDLENQATAWFESPKVSFANGQFIMGSSRSLHTSRDGSSWNVVHSAFEDYGHFVYGNGYYVGTKHSGASLSDLSNHSYNFQDLLFEENLFIGLSGNNIIYSSDGQSWSTAASNMINSWKLSFGGGTFVTYSADGLFKSENGISWAKVNLPTGMRPEAMQYGNNTWVAFSGNVCYISTDAVSWTQADTLSIPNHSASFIYNIYFVDGKFIVPYWDEYYWSSSDGRNWKQTELKQSFVRHQGHVYSPAHSNSDLLVHGSPFGVAILGNIKSSASRTIISSHGSTLATNLGQSIEMEFSAFSSSSSIENIEIFVNGERWESLPPHATRYKFTPSIPGLYTVEVISNSQDGQSSSDSLTVEVLPLLSISKPADEFALNDLIYFRGSYYGVGTGGLLYLSTDGIQWRTISTPVVKKLTSIVANEDTLVIGYQGQGVLTSKDGVNWTQTGNFPSDHVLYDNGLFIAGLSWKTMLSRDGITWTSAEEPSAAEAAGVAPDEEDRVFNAYNQVFKGGIGRGWRRILEFEQVFSLGDYFIGLNYNGELQRSEDLSQWESIALDRSVEKLSLQGGLLFASEYSAILYVTTDGVNWEKPDTDISSNAIEFYDGKFYVWSYDWNYEKPYKIVYSKNGINWERYGSEALQSDELNFGNLVASPTGFANFIPEATSYTFITESGIADSKYFDGFGFRERIKIIGESPVLALTDHQSYYLDDKGAWQRTAIRVEEDTVYANGVYFGDWHFGFHRSENGVDWTLIETPDWLKNLNNGFSVDSLQSDGSAIWLTVVYTENGFYRYATGRSEDGVNWQTFPPEESRPYVQYLSFKGKSYSNSFQEFKRLSDDFTSSELIKQFSDYQSAANTDNLIGILHQEDSHSGIQRFTTSSDGATWQTHSIPITSSVSIVATSKAFYLFGESVWKSTDGSNWTNIIPYSAKATTTRDEVLFFSEDLTFIETVTQDLAIDSASVANKEYGVSDTVEISVSLKNYGSGTLSWPEDSQVRYSFLSQTGRWSKDATEAGFSGTTEIPFNRLGGFESRSFTFNTKIPEGIEPNRYYLSVYLDYDMIGKDGNKSNDFLVSTESSTIVVPSRSLSISEPQNGIIEGAPAQSDLAWKDRIQLRAIPDFGYEFANWNGDAPYAEPVILLTLANDTNLSPSFTTRTYAVNVNVEGRGNITGIPDSQTIEHGQDLNLQVSEQEGWVFLGWEGYGDSKSESFNAKVGRNLNISAKFGRTYSSWADNTLPEGEEKRGLFEKPSNSIVPNIERFALGLDFADQRAAANLGSYLENGSLVYRYATYAGIYEVQVEALLSQDAQTWQRESNLAQLVQQTEDLDIHEIRIPLPQEAAPILVTLRIKEIDTK